MKSVGEPIERRDAHAKVTGQARYSYEVQVADAVYGVLVTSTIAKGRVESIDASEALHGAGVIEVLTPFNAMKLPGGAKPADAGDRVIQVLQDPIISYSGQPIALAIADTVERAFHAARLVKAVEIAEPFTVRLQDEQDKAIPHDLMSGGNTLPADQTRGDPAAGLLAAKAKLEQTYQTPPVIHVPMEPHATLAVWTSPGKLVLYDATQGIYGVRKKLAKSFALPLESVRVITKFVGGGFGCKGSAWSHVTLAAMAAKQLGRPVKIALTRPQMFGMVGGRPHTVQPLTAGADAEGKLTVLKHESFSSTSRFDDFIEPAASVSRHMYKCPNVETKHRIVRIDIGTPTYMRAPGESSGSFALESAMDELACELQIDPLQMRLTNYAEIDPTDDKPFSSKSLRECYRLAAEKFDWSRRSQKVRAKMDGHELVGMGMATASYPANQAKCDAKVRIDSDGNVLVQSGAVELGGGSYTINAQVAADALGVDVAKVRFELGDTELPEAPRSGGSITAASTASAIEAACQALKDKLIELAIIDKRSPIFGEHGAIAGDGKVSANNKAEAYISIAKRNGGAVEALAHVEPSPERKKFSLHSFGAQFAEVRVDPDLGMVRVVRLTGCFAAGRILNARLARSQFMGGMVWGIGMALHEHASYDPKIGRIMSRDYADYHVPTHADVIQLDPMFIPLEDDPHVDRAGVKGIGEIGITGAAAAIGNAVFNATGVRVRVLPITPDKLII